MLVLDDMLHGDLSGLYIVELSKKSVFSIYVQSVQCKLYNVHVTLFPPNAIFLRFGKGLFDLICNSIWFVPLVLPFPRFSLIELTTLSASLFCKN